jgi:hypothetical protein
MPLPDIDDLDSVGGEINDYRTVPDPTVERTATSDNKIAADAVMATRTATRVWVKFTGHATTPTVSAWDAVWKGSTVTAPTVTRDAAGLYAVTFPATVLDELGDEHTLNLRGGWGAVAARGSVGVAVTSPNACSVYTDAAGVADDFVGTAIHVFLI